MPSNDVRVAIIVKMTPHHHHGRVHVKVYSRVNHYGVHMQSVCNNSVNHYVDTYLLYSTLAGEIFEVM